MKFLPPALSFEILKHKIFKINILFLFGVFISGIHCSKTGWIDPLIKQKPVVDEVEQDKSAQASNEEDSGDNPKQGMVSIHESKPGDMVSIKPDSKNMTGETFPKSSEEEPEQSKTRTYPVTYSAGELVREYGIHPIKKKKDILIKLRKKAKVVHHTTVLKADQIQIFGNDGDYLLINNPLQIDDKEQNVVLTAGYGEYRKNLREVYVKNNPVITHRNPENRSRTVIRSTEMVRNFEKRSTTAINNVEIEYSDGSRAYGKKGTYFDLDDRFILEGNPVVYLGDNVISSETMTLFNREKKVLLNGAIKVLMTQHEGSSSSDVAKVSTIIESEKAEYFYDQSAGKTMVITFYKVKDKKIKITRDDSISFCDKLVVKGEKIDEIEMTGNVNMEYRKDKTKIFTEKALYRKIKDEIKMETVLAGSKKIVPYILFYNTSGELSGKLTTQLIERKLKAKKSYARGDVNFELYNVKDNQNNSADKLETVLLKSEWAEMEDDRKEVFLLGEPYIDYTDSRIYASKMVIYTQQNRMELLGEIRGKFNEKIEEEQ